MSHYKYNEWLGKVEIGKWALKWSMQGIIDGSPRLRLEFIIHNHHTTLAFELWVATILAPEPYVSYQDG
eukprot:scaffold226360_cov26-Cyclotella_meneghiniana.AAC.1